MASHLWNLLKLEDYYFTGGSDPDEYFEWEHKMNEFFILCDRPDFEKVFIAADQLINHAQDWWSQYTSGHLRQPTWDEMKNLLRKQYIPRDRYHEIRRQFRTLCQDDKTVMEYHSQFKYLRTRLNPGVSNEDVVDQFVNGLRDEIHVYLRRYTCCDLEELFQRAVQIELATKEPEPPDPPDESPPPKVPTEKEEPQEAVQQHSSDLTMSHEQVLRTKLFEERENDVVLISTDDILISTVNIEDVVIKPEAEAISKTVAVPEANQMVNPTPYQTSQGANQDICALKMPYLINQEGFNHEANFIGFYTQEGVQLNWNRAIIFMEQDVMNFTSHRFSSPSICEYQALEEDSSPAMKQSSSETIMGFKRDFSALQKARNQENWSRKLGDMINFPKPVKPALDLPYLEHFTFKAPHIFLLLDELVVEILQVINLVPKQLTYLPKLSRYKEPPHISLFGQDQAIMVIPIKPLIEL